MKNNLFKYIFKAILVFLLFYYSWILQVIPVILFDLDLTTLSEQTGVFLNAFSSIILCIILYFLYRKEINNEFIKFKNNFSNNIDIGAKYWFIGLIGMMLFNNLINSVFNGGQAGNEETVQSMIGALPWMMLINAGMLAPWSEEIIFRKSLKDIFKNKWLYIFISGLLFGLAHVIGNVEVWTDWLFVLPYGSLGAAFAISYYESDTIFTPIAFHMLHNIVLVLISIFL